MGLFSNIRKKIQKMDLPSKGMMIEGDMSYMSPIRKGGMKVNPDSPMGRRMIEEYKKRRGIGDALSRRGGGFFGGLPFIKEKMSIGDMRFRDPRFEDRRRRRGLAGLFGRVPEKLVSRMQDQVPFGPVSQPEMMSPQMMQTQLFGRPTEGISFSDINIENIPNLPDFSQGLPPEILERIQGNMQRMGRLPFADGEEVSTQSLIDFLNSDQEQVDFGFVRNLVKEIIIDPGRTISDKERQMLSDALERNPDILSDEELSIVSDQIQKSTFLPDLAPSEMRQPSGYEKYGDAIKGYAEGGEASFPDLTGDGKVTQADILKGRGVFAEGDEVSMMMMEMEGDEEGMQEEAIKQLEAARPEFEMMQQLAQIVINLLEQGASQEEIIAILQEQGLDEEDIQTLLEYVNEMMGQAEQVEMAEEDIGSQLAAIG